MCVFARMGVCACGCVNVCVCVSVYECVSVRLYAVGVGFGKTRRRTALNKLLTAFG